MAEPEPTYENQREEAAPELPSPPVVARPPLPPHPSPEEQLAARWAARRSPGLSATSPDTATIRRASEEVLLLPPPPQIRVEVHRVEQLPEAGVEIQSLFAGHDSTAPTEAAAPLTEIASRVFEKSANANAGWSASSASSVPWRSEVLRDPSSDSPQRFAMLHSLAKRRSPTLPTKRYLLNVGSRSEARQLAPVIRSLRERAAAEGRDDDVMVCATGDSPARVRQALESMRITVDFDLDIAVGDEAPATVSGRILNSFETLLAQVRPEWLVVQGASTLTAMASVAAHYAGVRVARIEGGPLSQHADRLYPSEIVRQVAGLFSTVHFAETDWTREQLVQEGVPDGEIFVIGNTGVDAVHESCAQLGLQVVPSAARSSGVVRVLVVIEDKGANENEVVDLCNILRSLIGSVPGLYEFTWTLPEDIELSRKIHDLLGRVYGVNLLPPAEYEGLLRLIHACDIVLTDSLDMQEEAPSLGKPVLMMREAVDRPEAVRAGVAILVGKAPVAIRAAVRNLARKLSSRHGLITNPYGDGRASARLADFFEGREVLEFGRTTKPRMLPPGSVTSGPRELTASTQS